MISEIMQNAINDQINKELTSEYIYLGMGAYFDDMDLPGFANFFYVQVEEERFHMMKLFRYLIERGGSVNLAEIPKPSVKFDSPKEVFELAYKHEQFITKSITDLMEVAISEKDHATQSFLHWFINEQVEEEASMKTIMHKLKLINGDGHGMLVLDNQLAARTFVPPEN